MTQLKQTLAEPPLDKVVVAYSELRKGTKKGVPLAWWMKIGAKIVLSRLMPSYTTRKSLRLFQHGSMDRDPKRQIRQVERVIGYHREFSDGHPHAILELGPGDSAGMAIVAKAMGMEKSYLVDVGDFATIDMAVYRHLLDSIVAAGYPAPPEIRMSDRDSMLASVNATYFTSGTSALKEVPDASIDMLFSAAVLEHVARSEFQDLIDETFRIMRPGAIAHHQIDLMDHIGGALNNLRFREGVWEHSLMSNSGFYTNRLRFSEILDRVKKAGFTYAVTQITRWPNLPTPRRALAGSFSSFSNEELKIATFGLLLQKPASAHTAA
jgi:hypothetical protein